MTSRLEATRETLSAALPDLIIQSATMAGAMDRPSVADGPVLKIADGCARGFVLALFADEGDPIDRIVADIAGVVERAVASGIELGVEDGLHSTLILAFVRAEPILDEADFRIGMTLHYQPIEYTRSVETV